MDVADKENSIIVVPEITGDEIVVKSNELIHEKSNPMSANEKDLLAILLSKYVVKTSGELLDIDVSFSDLLDLLGSPHGGRQINDLVKMLKTFYIHSVIQYKDNEGEIVITNFFSQINVRTKAKSVAFVWNPVLEPYLVNIQGAYTKYFIGNYCALGSKYSKDLYEHLKSWQKAGGKTYDLKDLRFILSIEDKYMTNKALMDCLRRAVKDINENTDIFVEIKPVYWNDESGRHLSRIKFVIKSSMQKKKAHK